MIASVTSAAELGEGEAALWDSCAGTFVQHVPIVRVCAAGGRYRNRSRTRLVVSQVKSSQVFDLEIVITIIGNYSKDHQN